MQSVLPHMLESGFGVIVNVASMSYRRGGPGASAKGAVVTMTMGVAREFAAQGIRCVHFTGTHRHPLPSSFSSRDDVPTVREDRGAVLFMCSNRCEFMTADTVCVNGGGGWR